MSEAIHGSIPSLMLIDHEGEPRVLDLQLAEALGLGRPRVIRELIARNKAELGRYGPTPCRTAMVRIGSGAQREVQEYLLNEPQALLLAVKSLTPQAADVREMLIRVFMEWRHQHHSEQDAIDVVPNPHGPSFNLEEIRKLHRELALWLQKVLRYQRKEIAAIKQIVTSHADQLRRIERDTGRKVAGIVNGTFERHLTPMATARATFQSAREVAVIALGSDNAVHSKLSALLSKELDRFGRTGGRCWRQGSVSGVPEKYASRTFPADGVMEWLTGPTGGLDWIRAENERLHRKSQIASGVLPFRRPDGDTSE
ncbi:MAG: hypothetical protein U1E62_21525 [Alsobacter sp.]